MLLFSLYIFVNTDFLSFFECTSLIKMLCFLGHKVKKEKHVDLG